jgi:hypothetical protein
MYVCLCSADPGSGEGILAVVMREGEGESVRQADTVRNGLNKTRNCSFGTQFIMG